MMRNILIALALSSVTILTGCSVNKPFYAQGGSRADGTVDMAYDFRQFEKPVVSVAQAKTIATEKCKVWGYQDAEAFGGQRQDCSQFNGYGQCIAGAMVIKYQCIGGQAAAPIAAFAPSANTAAAMPAGALTPEQWRQNQLDQLSRETGLSYDEYQRRYQQIMGQ